MNIDQIILITGAASGLGAASAELLSANGARVILFDQDAIRVNQLAKELNGFAFVGSVTDENQVKQMFDQIEKDIGIPRVCINCAGIAPAKRMVGKNGVMPLEDFKKVIDINLIGTFNMMRLAAERMQKCEPLNEENERGVIINTASIAAFEGQIGQTAYTASKGAIAAMTLPAARELAQSGIRVMAIAPGIMNTPMMAKMPDEVRSALSAEVPFPKRLGQAKEFALLVKHIIENSYLNGSVIRLDGALRMS